MWRKIKCFFGAHAPNCIKDEGTMIVQRCLYCDRIVTRFKKENNRIRRVM
jgi:hypothetical protein